VRLVEFTDAEWAVIQREQAARGGRAVKKKNQSGHNPIRDTKSSHAQGVLGEAAAGKLFKLPWPPWGPGPDGGTHDIVLPVTKRKAEIKTISNRGVAFQTNILDNEGNPIELTALGIACHPSEKDKATWVAGWIEPEVWSDHRYQRVRRDGKGKPFWELARKYLRPIEELMSAEGISAISRSRDNLARLYARCRKCGFQQLKTNKECAYCGRATDAA
jgi:hypothetical protein